MARRSIDFGIDLGTTNSSIAELVGMNVEAFKNNEGFEYTPSVVWYDRHNRLHVGREAKGHIEDDPSNTASEFKRQMGTRTLWTFERVGGRSPEELSAEVLKSLKSDVFRITQEEVKAAVITVPASFEAPQSEATRRAARLAGIEISPLLQEPVAAAMAYGFQRTDSRGFWLVYDFGGGTFDAAIIHVRDGLIEVVNHGGDTSLGGKDIDWDIVEKVLVPGLLKDRNLTDFRRGNVRWRAAFGKLKLKAEEAKIRCSVAQSAEIVIEHLCHDDKGDDVNFEYELVREEIEKLAEPRVIRTINVCRKILSEKKLGPGDIEKIILVGGPTLMPALRERLSDPQEGLGISLASHVDPLTVVARGAAIFAGTQRLETASVTAGPSGAFRLRLEYKPISAETEPIVGGQVIGTLGMNLSDYSIEFINTSSQPRWQSGRIALGSDGTFLTSLWADKDRVNEFVIGLYDNKGTSCNIEPADITYRVGLSITDPPLAKSIGVGLANNEVEMFFEKGTPLPARKMLPFKVAYLVRGNSRDALLGFPLIEGQDLVRADRNRSIGRLDIPSHEITRDIPAGSEIEVTIEIDASRMIKVKAYIPILDKEFPVTLSLEKKILTSDQLAKERDQEKARYAAIKDGISQAENKEAEAVLDRIEGENLIEEIDESVSASCADNDAADKCEGRLITLKGELDEAERVLRWPLLLKDAARRLVEADKTVAEYGDADDKKALQTLSTEIQKIVDAGVEDEDHLLQQLEELHMMVTRVLAEQPGFWMMMLEQLEKLADRMANPSDAETCVQQAKRAINNNDIITLRASVMQLWQMLPMEEQQKNMEFFSVLAR